MLVKNISAILIWSEDFRRLADWYKEKLDLEVLEELDHPEDTGVGFQVGDAYLWIGQHSEVKGKNKDIHRHMFNFVVDSVSETYEELKKRDVKFLAKPFKAPTMDRYFATFYDLDNNLVQLSGGK
ncbi:MAG TPA: VOC family protein [Candidatus Saccharimonadales bacterium]|nr:VOC family protein [Candidatus Saccharimonadales bacterium]